MRSVVHNSGTGLSSEQAPGPGLRQPGWSSPCRSGHSPVLGAVHYNERISGVADVANETGQDTSEFRQGEQSSTSGPQHNGGLDRSIRPGVPIPETLLVAQLCNGALLLQDWRDGVSAYIIPQDTGPLRHALATAFGSADTTTPPAQTVEPRDREQRR